MGNYTFTTPHHTRSEDLPKDDPAAEPTPEVAAEPVRRSGGYTNHIQ